MFALSSSFTTLVRSIPGDMQTTAETKENSLRATVAKKVLRKGLPINSMALFYKPLCCLCSLYGVLNDPFEQRKGERAKHWIGGAKKEAEIVIAVTLGPKGTQGDTSYLALPRGSDILEEMLELLSTYVDNCFKSPST